MIIPAREKDLNDLSLRLSPTRFRDSITKKFLPHKQHIVGGTARSRSSNEFNGTLASLPRGVLLSQGVKKPSGDQVDNKDGNKLHD